MQQWHCIDISNCQKTQLTQSVVNVKLSDSILIIWQFQAHVYLNLTQAAMAHCPEN